MRRIVFVAAILVFLCAPEIRAAVQKLSDREELVRLEQEWNAAYNRHDKGAVGSVLAEDYVLVDADAYVLNKQQYLDTISRVQVKLEKLKVIDVRVYGDAALVTTVWSGTYSFDGKDTTETIRYNDLFIRQGGKWKAVHSQGTRVPAR